MVRSNIVRFGALLGLAVVEPAGLAPARQVAPVPSVQVEAAHLEDVTRRTGPFEIGGQAFTVLFRGKRISGPGSVVDPDFQETLASVEILGPDGSIHHEHSFPLPETADGSFVETTSANAQFLHGAQGSGLLLTFGILPSTPLGGLSWQVFGVVGRRLMPFSKPVFLEGDLVNAGDGAQAIRASQEPGRDEDMLHFRVWTGNFFVIMPVEIDWLQGKLALAWQCQKMTARGPRSICQVSVQADRIPAEDETTFVRLHQEPEEGFGTPAHVVVRRDSVVEFLAAEAEVLWAEDENGIALTTSDDVWLKVRIDGKEGWIHSQEDFAAIGLPQAG